MTSHYELELYIAGRTPSSRRAVANLRRLCDEAVPDEFRLVVIDILERPELAEEKRILATPTLIRAYPAPARRLIGDMSDPEKVLFHLDMPPLASVPDPREGENE